VAILERLRGRANPQQQLKELQDALARIAQSRTRLYLNPDAIEDEFVQRRGVVDELIASNEIGGELGGGYLGFVSGKTSTRRGGQTRVEVTPLLKAILMEDAERERGRLVDLQAEEPRDGPLLFFTGTGIIFPATPPMPVIERPELRLSGDAAEALQRERETQGAADEKGTLVWVGLGRRTLASIAFGSFAQPGAVVSYREHPPFGILGKLERELRDVVLIKPLWIWREPPRQPA
jgi:hypothetical protein